MDEIIESKILSQIIYMCVCGSNASNMSDTYSMTDVIHMLPLQHFNTLISISKTFQLFMYFIISLKHHIEPYMQYYSH